MSRTVIRPGSDGVRRRRLQTSYVKPLVQSTIIHPYVFDALPPLAALDLPNRCCGAVLGYTVLCPASLSISTLLQKTRGLEEVTLRRGSDVLCPGIPKPVAYRQTQEGRLRDIMARLDGDAAHAVQSMYPPVATRMCVLRTEYTGDAFGCSALQSSCCSMWEGAIVHPPA